MGSIIGGSSAGSSDQSSQSESGFSQLPPQLQQAWEQYGQQVTDQYGNSNASAFTPIQQTSGETQAINSINKGFTPDAQTLQSNINMQTNPYDQSVINTINQQAQGQNSILNQQTSAAGQFGSNRAMLGANDIDLSRLNQIGTFKQGEYQNALNNALTVLPTLQANDASAQLQAGGFQRALGLQTSQAPINAMASYAQLMGIVPNNGGSTSTSSGTSNTVSGSGLNGIFGNTASAFGINPGFVGGASAK